MVINWRFVPISREVAKQAGQARLRYGHCHRRQKQKDQALSAIESKFEAKAAACERIGKAIVELSLAVKAFGEASEVPHSLPDECFSPGEFKDFDGPSSHRTLRHLAIALGLRTSEPFRRLTELPSEVGSLAEYERAHGAWYVQMLREKPLPRHSDPEEEAA